MSKTYKVKPGDTYSTIARAEFGSESAANTIAQMNPGVYTLVPFSSIQIPATGQSSRNFRPFGLDLRVNEKEIATIDSFTGSASLAGFRRFNFEIPNEVTTRLICKQFKPSPVDIGYNGFPMLAGYLGSAQPVKSENKKTLKIEAYSNPTVISSPMLADSFPLEFEKQNLDVITGTLLKPYTVEYEFVGEIGPVFSKIKIKQKQNTYEFLSGLSKQRALVIGDDGDGKMLYNNGMGYGEPVLKIDAEKRPDCSVSVQCSPEDMFSSVTGILRGKRGKLRKKITIINPHYSGIIRPHEFEVSECDAGEMETAVNSVMARTFGAAFRLNVTIAGWLDKFGELLQPGAAISVKSPSDYINDFFDFLISDVTWADTGSVKTTTMSCVIPGVYAGVIPEVVPWT